MATIASVTASPTTVSVGGGKSTITPVIVPSVEKIATVTVSVDGGSGTAQVSIHEPLVYSVIASDVGKTGYVVATVNEGGKLEVGANGTFVFIAS
jgi:hypothetical protein